MQAFHDFRANERQAVTARGLSKKAPAHFRASKGLEKADISLVSVITELGFLTKDDVPFIGHITWPADLSTKDNEAVVTNLLNAKLLSQLSLAVDRGCGLLPQAVIY